MRSTISSDATQSADPSFRAQSGSQYHDSRESDEIDLLSLVATLIRRRWLIGLLTSLALGAAYLYLETVRPLYKATAQVIVEESSAPVDLGQALMVGGPVDKQLETELEVLRSRTQLLRVIESLRLIEDPEFNPTVIDPDRRVTIKDWFEQRGFWPLTVVSYWPPVLEFADAREPPEFKADTLAMREAIDRLARKTSVQILRGTRIILIDIEAWSPEKAALIANELASQYINNRVEVKVDAQRFASQFIGRQVIELREEVEAAEAAAQAFRTENAIFDDASPDVARYEELQNRAQSAQTLVAKLESRLERFDAAERSGEGLRGIAAALDDPRISALVSAGFDREIRGEIEKAAERLKNDLRVAERRSETLQSSLLELDGSLEEGATNLVRLRQLNREAEASRVLFETFLTRQKETSVQADLLTPDARVLTKADPPYQPSSPRKLLILAMAGIVGMMLGSGLALILERSRNCFINIEELEAFTGYRVLGSVPRYRASRRRAGVLSHVRSTPGGYIAEAIRNLRTSILLANVDNPPQLVVLTSSVPEEGKSLTTLLLATITAQMGRSVIIIDADLRRSTLHNTLGVKAEPGLIAVLNGAATIEDAVRVDEESGLHMLPVENTRASPADLLSSDAFAKLIEDLRGRYDLILLDAPPVLPVTDARILAKFADALIYVVRWDDTPREIVRHGLASLIGIGVNVSGLVFTQVDRAKQKKYGSGYYGSYGYNAHKYYRKSERYYAD